jgi:hypothetical protein
VLKVLLLAEARQDASIQKVRREISVEKVEMHEE